ncbi:hypothetical protein P6166_04720 [Stenotrophomonas sp. HITSZ_GD]|uniref:hypothetical protein n=1 Tax=Stenotrophomonas sp. HITSZ_GD TaxID=3037248 RepID=UPI00240E8D5D|nr:hypothetical protein [Stenotrophomonas sp. HITSZ_GD]MDG2524661.1 hypothetical protein [Stenotrophomonas sp. HITSZ_GD]
MQKPTEAELVEVLQARCDALTWVATALIQSHQDLEVVRWRWHARRLADERAGRTQGEGIGYKHAYVDELAAWTETLDALIAARDLSPPSPSELT